MDKHKKLEKTLKIIALYRERESLWNNNSISYRRKELKKKAIKEIGRECNMTEECVKKKLKSLRSTYIMEKKKVDQSKESGCVAEDEYEPSLCWYREMSFLDAAISTRKSKDTVSNVCLDNKTKPKLEEKLVFTVLDGHSQIYKKHSVKPADQQICGLSTSRKVTAVFENTKTSDDELSRDPISITMSPNRDIKSEMLREYEATEPLSNHSICMEVYDSNTIDDSANQDEDDDKVATEDGSNSPLGTQDYTNNQDSWEDMKRKKLRLELEQLELTNYKIKLDLYEKEQKLKLNCSKFTVDIRDQQLPNIECD